MKKCNFLIGAAISVFAFIGTANAATIPVTVSSNTAKGTFNVGFTSGAGSIGAEFSSSSKTILFKATNPSGNTLACFVNPTDTNYQEAKDIFYSLKLGSYLVFTRNSTGRCGVIVLRNYSNYL